MKIFLLNILSLISLCCISQYAEPEFGLYFGNEFNNDTVSIKANGIVIAEKIILKPTMYDPENLMIEQRKDFLVVASYGVSSQKIKKVPIENSILIFDVMINRFPRRFTVDLKKGKYIFARFVYIPIGWSTFKILIFEQQQFGPIIL
jgi:hypothetical protein